MMTYFWLQQIYTVFKPSTFKFNTARISSSKSHMCHGNSGSYSSPCSSRKRYSWSGENRIWKNISICNSNTWTSICRTMDTRRWIRCSYHYTNKRACLANIWCATCDREKTPIFCWSYHWWQKRVRRRASTCCYYEYTSCHPWSAFAGNTFHVVKFCLKSSNENDDVTYLLTYSLAYGANTRIWSL